MDYICHSYQLKAMTFSSIDMKYEIRRDRRTRREEKKQSKLQRVIDKNISDKTWKIFLLEL